MLISPDRQNEIYFKLISLKEKLFGKLPFGTHVSPGIFIALLLMVAAFSLSSCKYFKSKPGDGDEKPLARVADNYLYYSDIAPALKSAGNPKDSATFVSNYINDWIKRKLLVEKAMIYLTEDQLDVERQVGDYRESLILYAYEKALILEQLDTVVSEGEARSKYDEFRQNFELDNDIVRLQYVKVLNNAPGIDSLITWLGSAKDGDLLKLEDYCHQYAAVFSLNDSVWFEVPAVLTTIPVTQDRLDGLIASKTRTTLTDSVYHYALKVNDFKRKGDIAPFQFVKDDIIHVILNKRKMDLVRSKYDNIYNEAQQKNEFEIYK